MLEITVTREHAMQAILEKHTRPDFLPSRHCAVARAIAEQHPDAYGGFRACSFTIAWFEKVHINLPDEGIAIAEAFDLNEWDTLFNIEYPVKFTLTRGDGR